MANNNRKQAIKKLRLLSYNSKIDINVFRKKIEDEFKTVFLPNKTERTERTFGGITCDFLSPEIYSSRRILLYIHGGCFTGGSRAAYRNFASMLANKAYSRVVVPEYRLSPAHPFPAATEDVQAAFRALFTEEQIARSLDQKAYSMNKDGERGYSFSDDSSSENSFQNESEINSNDSHDQNPTSEENQQASEKLESEPEVIICADGAGASIACSLIFNMREKYKKSIKKLVLFSPWLDISGVSPLRSNTKTSSKAPKKLSDEILSSDVISKSADAYTYSSNFTNPLVSPIYASKELLQDFPPTYIQIGQKEILLQDAKDFKNILLEAGVDCILDEWPDMMHLFQLADEYLDEAHEALDKFSWIIAQGMEAKQNTETISIENKPKLENSLRSEA